MASTASSAVVPDLLAQIDRQRQTIRELQALLRGKAPGLPPEWGLSRREAQIFTLLCCRDRVTKDAIIAAFYASPEDEDVEDVIVYSHISKMRPKLARYGIEIQSTRRLGYQLKDRARFRPLVEAVFA